MRDALGAPAADAVEVTTARPAGSRWRRVATRVGAAIAASTVTGVALWLIMRPILSPLPVSRFTITPASAAALTISLIDRDLTITPDGTRIVYVGANGSALFVRSSTSSTRRG